MRHLVLIFLIFFSFSTLLFAAIAPPRPDIVKAAEIVATKGSNSVRYVRQKEWYPAVVEQLLAAGDTLKTAEHGKMDVLFVDGTQIKVHAKTHLVIKRVRQKNKKGGTFLDLSLGELWSRTKSTPEQLQIKTPSATAAIRGTDWDIAVDEDGSTHLTVFKGTIDLGNPHGSVRVAAGEQAVADIGKAPVKRYLVRPEDRVQWIANYQFRTPRIVSFQDVRHVPISIAVTKTRERLESQPGQIDLKTSLAGLLYDQRAYHESRRLLDEVLTEDPGNTRATFIKGLVLLAQGETAASEQLLSGSVNHLDEDEQAKALIGLADAALQDGRIDSAKELLDKLENTGTAELAGIARASFMAYDGKFRQAVQLCDVFLKRFPDDDRFLVMKSEFLLILDEPEAAKTALLRALELNENSSQAYTVMGRYEYLEGRGDASEKAFRRAIALNPGNVDASSELGRLLMEKGEYEESDQLLTSAVSLNPLDSSALSRRGMLMNWLEKIADAKADFSHALELNSADYQSLDGLGFLALKEGRTEDAIDSFTRASTLEPGFAEPHIFLGIAYYQQGLIEQALESLELAKVLDPKDPLPYMITYIIYQDTYRPFQSVQEAGRAIELLPNLKSVNPIETTNQGLSNLGVALLDMELTEWATSYAEESFDPFEASGYHFVAKKFSSNPMAFVSGSTHGFLMDPLSIGSHQRYQDIVARPHQDVMVNTRLGDEDGGFVRELNAAVQGYLRQPLEVRYLLDYEISSNDGFLENNDVDDKQLTYALGLRPDYRNSYILFGGLADRDYGEPVDKNADYLANDRYESSFLSIDGGYNRRIGNNNNLLVNIRYSKTKVSSNNPDPYGSGLSNDQLSFVDFFGVDNARSLLDDGIFDVTDESVFVGPWPFRVYGFDSSGLLSELASNAGTGVVPVSNSLPGSIDPNPVISSHGTREGVSYQVKHLFEIDKSHKVSWGAEYSPVDFKINSLFSFPDQEGVAMVIDEYPMWAFGGETVQFSMPYLETGSESYHVNLDSKFYTAYVNDRWSLSRDILIDWGLYYERFTNDLNNSSSLNPRIGLAMKVDRHLLRAAFQERVLEAFEMTLAPVTTAGLYFDWIQLFPGARLKDYQVSIESRWNERLFTSLGYELRKYSLPELGASEFPKQNRAHIVSLALNTILTDKLAGYARYKYTDSENTSDNYRGKATPLVPVHAATAGLSLMLPCYVSTTLSLNYADIVYDDAANSYKLPKQLTMDFFTSWESQDKHWLVEFEVNNLFDQSYEEKRGVPAAGRSTYVSLEYRF